jgi:hypothetical protein
MNDTKPQTAQGMAGRNRPGPIDKYVTTTDAVLGGRAGWDIAAASGGRPYGGDWDGPILVLTHHPEDATPADGVTVLNYDMPLELDLLEQRSFKQGVTMHRYAIRDAKEASSC